MSEGVRLSTDEMLRILTDRVASLGNMMAEMRSYMEANRPPEALVGYSTAMELLNVKPTKFYELVKSKKFPVYRIGDSMKFKPSEVLAAFPPTYKGADE